MAKTPKEQARKLSSYAFMMEKLGDKNLLSRLAKNFLSIMRQAFNKFVIADEESGPAGELAKFGQTPEELSTPSVSLVDEAKQKAEEGKQELIETIKKPDERSAGLTPAADDKESGSIAGRLPSPGSSSGGGG